MNSPLVSVGTLCYNSGKNVIKTLESVKNQSYKNIEHIIIDDASTDDSTKLLDEWIVKNNYSCKFIKRTKNQGYHEGLNQLIREANGEFLGIVYDDTWHDEKIEKEVACLKKADAQTGFVYSDAVVVDEKNSIVYKSFLKRFWPHSTALPEGNIFNHLLFNYFFLSQSCLFRKNIFETTGFYAKRKYLSDDWHMQLTVAKYFSCILLNEVLCTYYFRENSEGRKVQQEKNNHRLIASDMMMIRSFFYDKNISNEEKISIISALRNRFNSIVEDKYSRYFFKVKYACILFSTAFYVKDLIILTDTILNAGGRFVKLLNNKFNW